MRFHVLAGPERGAQINVGFLKGFLVLLLGTQLHADSQHNKYHRSMSHLYAKTCE
ncbi:hypothetical protein DPMN_107919 [Dreissena polymorpha]|uniref:Uncharacterized protein n=1 Tax=Dreissena polymorpha TaxID=45954 RepID=A0A9D4K7X8_DREPO|nr:hypothetical protein DPMN_107919 [Dreissena polymorpha]